MIDDIDRRILMLLQEDARLSNAALAKEVGLTVSTVHERVKKLERKDHAAGKGKRDPGAPAPGPVQPEAPGPPKQDAGSDGGDQKGV